jgi:two-component system OmpR family sensor kinase
MHPLVSDLSGLSNEDLHKKYNELMSKMNQAYKFGPAGIILGQIGGDLNSTEITSYLQSITTEQVIERANQPFTIEAPQSDFRVIAQRLPTGLGTVVVAQSFEDIDRTLLRLQGLFILIGLVMILFIALASRKVITVGLRPLATVEATAERIAEGD